MSNRSFRLSPRRLSPKQQLPLLSSSNSIHHGNSSSNWRETSASHDFFLTDPVPLPPLLTQQAEESFRFMDRNRNDHESRPSKMSSNSNTNTRRLLSKMFSRKQKAAKTSSDAYSYTTHSTTHSPLKSKATAAAAAGSLQVPFSSRSKNNRDSSSNSKTHSHSNSTTLGLSRDATRVLRPSQQKRMQMHRQQSTPDLVGSVLVLPKRIHRDTAAAPTIAAAIVDTNEKDFQQHGLNQGVNKDEVISTEILLQSPPSPRRHSRAAAATTTTPSPTHRRLQFKLTKWQQSFRTGTPLSPSSVTAMNEATEFAVEKTTLTRNDDSYRCQTGLVGKVDDGSNLNECKYKTDPSKSAFSPTYTGMSSPFDGAVEEKPSFSSLQKEPSVEMACSGDLQDKGEDKETLVRHSSISIDRDVPWRSVPCRFCANTLYCANDDAEDAVDLLVFCSECYGTSPVRVDNVSTRPRGRHQHAKT